MVVSVIGIDHVSGSEVPTERAPRRAWTQRNTVAILKANDFCLHEPATLMSPSADSRQLSAC